MAESKARELKRGDRVEWNFRGRRVVGVVVRRLTERMTVGRQQVAASKEDPRFLVRSEGSGKQAAHKPTALRRLPKR
jgi:hypothetical protein